MQKKLKHAGCVCYHKRNPYPWRQRNGKDAAVSNIQREIEAGLIASRYEKLWPGLGFITLAENGGW